MDGWKTTFLLGRPIFRGYVSFREGGYCEYQWCQCLEWATSQVPFTSSNPYLLSGKWRLLKTERNQCFRRSSARLTRKSWRGSIKESGLCLYMHLRDKHDDQFVIQHHSTTSTCWFICDFIVTCSVSPHVLACSRDWLLLYPWFPTCSLHL